MKPVVKVLATIRSIALSEEQGNLDYVKFLRSKGTKELIEAATRLDRAPFSQTAYDALYGHLAWANECLAGVLVAGAPEAEARLREVVRECGLKSRYPQFA